MRAVAPSILTVLAASLLVAGCIGPGYGELEPNGATPAEPPSRVVIETHEENKTGAPVVAFPDPVQVAFFEVQSPPATVDAQIALHRDQDLRAVTVQVTEPDGDATEHTWDGPDLQVRLDDPGVGTLRIDLLAEGVHPETDYGLVAKVRWVDADAAVDAVHIMREGDAYRAEVTYFASAAAGAKIDAAVDLFNGDIEIVNTGDKADNATAEVTTWARAKSAERARELVEAIQLDLSLTGSHLTADVEEYLRGGDSESVGARGRFSIPTVLAGTMDTSNGQIHVDKVDSRDLTLDTSNGEVTGSIAASKRLAIDTSNGKIDLRIEPVTSLRLDLDTSNGDVHLALIESSDHSYDLEVDTSNGEVTESMDDAEFDATDDDEDEGRLKSNGDSRNIHTTGVVDTSNGDVHFDSA